MTAAAPRLPNVVHLDETDLTYVVAGLHTYDNEATVKLVEISEWNRRRRAIGLPETLLELQP